MTPDRIDLVYRILDDQLVDVDGRRCGRVDDLEFDDGPGEQPRLSAILSGSGVWHRRMPRALRTAGARMATTKIQISKTSSSTSSGTER